MLFFLWLFMRVLTHVFYRGYFPTSILASASWGRDYHVRLIVQWQSYE